MALSLAYNSTNTSLAVEHGGGTHADAILAFIPFLLTYVVNPILTVLALAASIVNIIAFAKMDLNQGVNMNLLVLSASDTAMAALLSYLNGLYVLTYMGYGSKAMNDQMMIIRSFTNFPLYMSIIITAIIAVVRCVSIVLPLSFRNILTAKRQLAIMLTSCAVMSAILSYLLIKNITYSFRPTINGTRGPSRTWKDFDIFRNVLLYGCLSASAVSMLFLIVALKKSSQFQRQATMTKSANGSHKSSTKSSSTREARVIKTVIVVVAIFVLCNLPLILLSILRAEVPGFTFTGPLSQWFGILFAICSLSVVLNVGLNSFAYYHFNSRYRQIVKTLFTGRSGEDVKA